MPVPKSELDRNQVFPRELVKELADRKFLSIIFPKSLDGLELDPVTYGLFFEHAGKYDEIKKGHIEYILKGLDRFGAEEWVEEGLDIMKRIADKGWLNRFTKKIK